jgi:nucleoside-diphosphate kinase
MIQKTLSIVKPDGVKTNHIGDVISRFEKNGLKVVGLKMITLSKADAEGFYAVHKQRPFFGSLTGFMSSGPAVVMVLEGENAVETVRKLMGATDPAKADKGTIRADFAANIEQNVVHGSDSPQNAKLEIAHFFSGCALGEPCQQ